MAPLNRQVISLKGDKELVRALRKLSGPQLRGVVRDACRAAMSPVAQSAKMLAPVGETGLLKKSIGIIVHRTNPRTGNIVVSVRPRKGFQRGILNKQGKGGRNVDPRKYAHLVEQGTVKNKAKPFLRPAFDGRQLAVQMILKARLWRGIRRIAARAAARKAA